MQQALDTFLHEALLPAPHRRLGNARLAHDRVRAVPVGAEENDARPPDVLLKRVPIRYERDPSR